MSTPTPADNYEALIASTAQWLANRMPTKPDTAIVLGTGLDTLADDIAVACQFAYKDIPNFPVSTVEGHAGALIVGTLAGRDVIALRGRFHYYEGYTMKQVTFYVRVLHALGVGTLIVSNAAGGCNPAFRVGDIMVIDDHINLFPDNPLRGRNIAPGPRFLDMHDAYDPALRAAVDGIAGSTVRHGVYLGLQGPSYETPAEYRAFHTLGADAVGMSTVPEVIVARHCAMRVLGLSVITNMGLSDTEEKADHEEVQAAAATAGPRMANIVKQLLNANI